MLELVQKTLYEIRNTLKQDEVLRKLLYNDSNNALQMVSPDPAQIEKYITIYPIYEFQNKNDLAQNALINVLFNNGTAGEDVQLDGVLQVNIVVNVDHWDLIGGKVRPLEIADRVIKLLNNKKFSISNPLEFTSIDELIITKQLVGYAVLFDFTDGSGEIDHY